MLIQKICSGEHGADKQIIPWQSSVKKWDDTVENLLQPVNTEADSSLLFKQLPVCSPSEMVLFAPDPKLAQGQRAN